MTKRMLATFALGLFAMGCAGSNEEAREDDEPRQARPAKHKKKAPPMAEEEEAEVAEAPAPAPAKLHGPKKRIGIVDFDDASHHGGWGSSRNALAESARDAATELMVKSGAFVVIE